MQGVLVEILQGANGAPFRVTARFCGRVADSFVPREKFGLILSFGDTAHGTV